VRGLTCYWWTKYWVRSWSVFDLAFVVEVVVGYNPFMHKTQSQKLIFLVFCGFFSRFYTQPQPQIQTHTILWSTSNTNTHYIVIDNPVWFFFFIYIKNKSKWYVIDQSCRPDLLLAGHLLLSGLTLTVFPLLLPFIFFFTFWKIFNCLLTFYF